MVTLKVHIRKTLDPRYEGTYRVIQVKGNQVEIADSGTVTPTKWAHITHLKPLLRADEIIDHLPMGDTFARKTKLALNPEKILDLHWQRATQLNTPKTQQIHVILLILPNILERRRGEVKWKIGRKRGV